MKTSRRHRLTKVLPPNLQGRSQKVAELLRTPVVIANSPRASRVRRRYPKRKPLRRPRTVATTRTTNLKRQHPSLKPNPRRKRTTMTTRWTLTRRNPSPSPKLNPRRSQRVTKKVQRRKSRRLLRTNYFHYPCFLLTFAVASCCLRSSIFLSSSHISLVFAILVCILYFFLATCL